MENILCNKYISNKKSINKEINKESQINKIGEEKSEEEDDYEIDTKIFNGLLAEDKKLNTINSNSNNNDKITTQENKNSRNFDTYINENNNLVDLNFISFGDVNSLYNFQNGKTDIINKKSDSKNKNIINQNNKLTTINNKLTLNSPINKLKIDEKTNIQTIQKNKRKNSNGSNNEENAFFLNKQILKINNLFDELNMKKYKENKNDKNEEMEIVRNYWESRAFFKISEINKGNAILVSMDDNIINFPAFLLPKEAKIGEIYNFEIKSMDKGFIYKNQKANEIDDIQKKFLNPD